jgi:hypothetical protein
MIIYFTIFWKLEIGGKDINGTYKDQGHPQRHRMQDTNKVCGGAIKKSHEKQKLWEFIYQMQRN